MPTFMSPTERDEIAALAAKRINIPFRDERQEKDIFLKMVTRIDQLMCERIPDEFLASIRDRDFQVEEYFVDALEERLAPMLKRLIFFPFIPEETKDRIVEYVAGVIVTVFAGATTLDEEIERRLGEIAAERG